MRLFISALRSRDKLTRAIEHAKLLAYVIIILLYKKLSVYNSSASEWHSIRNLLKSS